MNDSTYAWLKYKYVTKLIEVVVLVGYEILKKRKLYLPTLLSEEMLKIWNSI